MFICKACGGGFDRKSKRGRFPYYCSQNCKTGGRKTDLVRSCDICGIGFVANVKGNPRRCCSVACKNEKENQRLRKSRVHSKKCVVCETEFVTSYKATVSCSSECQRERVRAYGKIKWVERLESRPSNKVWVCKWCEKDIVVPFSYRGTRVYHDVCRVKARRHNDRIKNVRRQNAKVSPGRIDVELIAERDKFVCHICLGLVDMYLPRTSRFGATLDHVFPLSKGGEDSEANVKLAHWICNIKKSNKVEGNNG